ncbi:MAG: hypothetical protein K2M73_09555 [Lachnospiraceae bacterium]|nr:hypothetical protein [Lachnospiraceae bacterium]
MSINFDDLPIKEELISLHAANPFAPTISAARLSMFSSHISQSVVLNDSKESIIQTGIEKQLGENTFSVRAEKEVMVVDVIKRYNNISADLVTQTTSVLIITQDLETSELDYIEVPYNFSPQVSIANGFKYIWDEDLINSLRPGSIIPKGTIMADSPSVKTNSGYGYGRNCNMALITLPDVAEDGVVISESCSKKLSYTVFDVVDISFGTHTFPLNVYGDSKIYKPFPEIGDLINDSAVVMALRNCENSTAPELCSINDVKSYDVFFDKVYYTRDKGKIIDGNIASGVVVDIKAWKQPRNKKELYTGMDDILMKYVNSYKLFCKKVVDTYHAARANHRKKTREDNIPLSPKFQRYLNDCMVVVNEKNYKFRYSFRNNPEDLYRMQFTIQFHVNLGLGGKISDCSGCKGVVVDVRPDNEMPVDMYGNRAEIIMDSTSIANRMCVGRLYHQDFCDASRYVKEQVTEIMNKGGDSEANYYLAYEKILDLLKVLGTEQFKCYQDITDINQIKEIVDETIRDELYLYYKVSSAKKPYEIALELKEKGLNHPANPVYLYKNGDYVLTKKNVVIAPIYTIVLAKSADLWLSTPSSVTNHYGLPIGVNSSLRRHFPWRNNPVKVMSETETRLFASYTSPLALAELKDRANNINTQRHMYKKILEAPQPTNIDCIVDRDEVPYGGDVALQLLNDIINAGGIEMKYVEEKE